MALAGAGDEQSVRCFVSGRVQGVFYRAGTAEQAGALGLRGYARNLPDGRVEVVVQGPPGAVSQLLGWLWGGPPNARVTGVIIEEYRDAVPDGFSIE